MRFIRDIDESDSDSDRGIYYDYGVYDIYRVDDYYEEEDRQLSDYTEDIKIQTIAQAEAVLKKNGRMYKLLPNTLRDNKIATFIFRKYSRPR